MPVRWAQKTLVLMMQLIPQPSFRHFVQCGDGVGGWDHPRPGAVPAALPRPRPGAAPARGPMQPPRHCPGRSRYRTRSAAAPHAVYSHESHPARAHASALPCLHGDSGRGCWSRRKSEQIRRRKTQFHPTCEARQLKLSHDVARKGHLRQALRQCRKIKGEPVC